MKRIARNRPLIVLNDRPLHWRFFATENYYFSGSVDGVTVEHFDTGASHFAIHTDRERIAAHCWNRDNCATWTRRKSGRPMLEIRPDEIISYEIKRRIA